MNKLDREQWRERINLSLHSLDKYEKADALAAYFIERVDSYLDSVRYVLGAGQEKGFREIWGERFADYVMNFPLLNRPVRWIVKDFQALGSMYEGNVLAEVADEDHLELIWHLTDNSKPQIGITLPYSNLEELTKAVSTFRKE